MIRKVGSKWVLFTKDGSRRLGTHNTREEAVRQEAAVKINKHRNVEERELHLLGAVGPIRAEIYDGREHLVVPVVALMEGVIHAVNAPDAEFVSAECLSTQTYGWNGRPVVLGHPTRDGRQISANDPAVLEQHKFGTVFQSHMNGKRLGMEAWIDPKRLEVLGQHDLLKRIRAGEPIEVSVGAFVKTLAGDGNFNGKAYKASWKEITPDHLAFLPKTRGACSLEMGCGAHRVAEELRAAEGEIGYETYQVTDEGLTALGGPGSGWSAEAGHVPGSQGGAGRGKAVTEHHLASKAHEAAATAHQTAASAGQKWDTARTDTSSKGIYEGGHAMNTYDKAASQAHDMTKAASAATKDTGAKPYSGQAAKSYSDMAAKAKQVGDAVKYHQEAVKYHTAAAREHKIAASWGVKHLEGREQMDRRSLRERVKALLGFKAADASEPEEAAELIAYNTLRSLHDQMCTLSTEASDLIDELIGAETKNPALSNEDEAAEEEIEGAQLEALCTLYGSMMASLSAASQLAWKLQLPDLPSPTSPRYAEELRAALGKRNNATDQQTIQQVHDNAVALGAECTAITAAEELGSGGTPAEGESMTKEVRAATIKTLSECSCSGFTKDDVKLLEGMTDTQLTQLETVRAKAKKADDDLKVAQEKTEKAEAALKAAEGKELTEEQVMKAAPEALRSLVERAKSQDAARKKEIVEGVLKAAEGVYSKEELEAKSLEELEKIGQLAQLPASHDFSASRSMPRAAGEKDVYANPPDGYALAIEANKKKAAVN